ncbi:unnamed protein product [Rangifer tarandus platyrhynchus]|uniref:Uncharacterized protein n=2 Tax=Rangifer tarandus platyrhynchus TaxID=3082113 RepID=A0ACB0EAS1_RANTA|nr:unnamed protein product [Rangifer tarandus platyrhynchus]CAI9697720.1 unnamed protein product [Rangifer tarandus platyrhynchus]
MMSPHPPAASSGRELAGAGSPLPPSPAPDSLIPAPPRLGPPRFFLLPSLLPGHLLPRLLTSAKTLIWHRLRPSQPQPQPLAPPLPRACVLTPGG